MSKKFTKPEKPQKSQLILYGRHAVFAALSNPKREISKLLCTKENLDEIRRLSKITPQIVERKEIDKLFPNDAVHQGFALFCKPLPNYALEDIVALSQNKDKCHVLILDQVSDPQNIGAIIRSAVAFNTLALIIQDKNSPYESGSMAKAAAGMIEHLPIVRVTNLSRAIEQLQKAGFWTIGFDGYAKDSIDKINRSGKIAIVMGSEGKGMRRLVEENCDMAVRLPMSPLTESLNVAVAASIALYEINKEE